VLERQGKYEEAEAMHRQALRGYEKVLGPEHPELPDDLVGAVILLLFPILKSLYGSKSVGRPNRDNRVQVIVWDLFFG
jgi:Tetratricopeptide repeat